MANLKTIMITCTNANTAYNCATGTTSAPTSRNNALVGAEISIQNQGPNTAAIVTVGEAPVATGGIKLTYLSVESGRGFTSSSWQLPEIWVSADVAGTVVCVQIRKQV